MFSPGEVGPATPGPWSDKLTIDTPEQTPLEFPLAGIGSRFLALALDTLIQFAATFLLVLAGGLMSASLQKIWRGGWTWPLAGLVLVLFWIFYGYFALFEALWNGQTPGKRITRLRVIQESGRPITVYQAVARNLLRVVDQLPSFYAVGILSALVSRQNKRLGDYVAGTVVVHEKPLAEVRPSWDAPERSAVAPPSLGTSPLSDEELQLVEAFLQRRTYLPAEVRAAMARQIAERLAQRLAISPEQRVSNASPGGEEAFLEALAQQRRSSAGYH